MIRTLRHLSWRDWGTAVEATICLALARLAVRLVRFTTLSPRLGVQMQETPLEDDHELRPVLRRIRWAIGAVSRRVPWRCMCLEQAIASKMMLRRRGIGSTLYLGVARDANTSGAQVEAHAWLRCGSYYVTGGETRSRYTVVSTYAEGKPR